MRALVWTKNQNLDVKSEPHCSYVLYLFNPAYPTCVTVDIKAFLSPVNIIVDLLLKGSAVLLFDS
jgi:hypothetical protein